MSIVSDYCSTEYSPDPTDSIDINSPPSIRVGTIDHPFFTAPLLETLSKVCSEHLYHVAGPFRLLSHSHRHVVLLDVEDGRV